MLHILHVMYREVCEVKMEGRREEIRGRDGTAGIVHGVAIRPTQTSQTPTRHTSMYDAALHPTGLPETAFISVGGHLAASLTIRTPGDACSSSSGTRSTGIARSSTGGTRSTSGIRMTRTQRRSHALARAQRVGAPVCGRARSQYAAELAHELEPDPACPLEVPGGFDTDQREARGLYSGHV
jgi:hypothetical protein